MAESSIKNVTVVGAGLMGTGIAQVVLVHRGKYNRTHNQVLLLESCSRKVEEIMILLVFFFFFFYPGVGK